MRIIYTCDTCRKRIVPEDVTRVDPGVEVALARQVYTLKTHHLIPMAVTEGTRYEWHFCSRECLSAWSAK